MKRNSRLWLRTIPKKNLLLLKNSKKPIQSFMLCSKQTWRLLPGMRLNGMLICLAWTSPPGVHQSRHLLESFQESNAHSATIVFLLAAPWTLKSTPLQHSDMLCMTSAKPTPMLRSRWWKQVKRESSLMESCPMWTTVSSSTSTQRLAALFQSTCWHTSLSLPRPMVRTGLSTHTQFANPTLQCVELNNAPIGMPMLLLASREQCLYSCLDSLQPSFEWWWLRTLMLLL